jgi:hypothetical protein
VLRRRQSGARPCGHGPRRCPRRRGIFGGGQLPLCRRAGAHRDVPGLRRDGCRGTRSPARGRSARPANGMPLIGPNSMGCSTPNPQVGLNASLAAQLPRDGGLGLSSQSRRARGGGAGLGVPPGRVVRGSRAPREALDSLGQRGPVVRLAQADNQQSSRGSDPGGRFPRSSPVSSPWSGRPDGGGARASGLHRWTRMLDGVQREVINYVSF